MFSLPIITAVSFASAFLRDILIARALGANHLSDSLWVALLLPAVFESAVGIPLRDSLLAKLVRLAPSKRTALRRIFAPALAAGLATVPLWVFQLAVFRLLAPDFPAALESAGVLAFALGLMFVPVHAAAYAQAAVAGTTTAFPLAHTRSVFLNLGAIVACLLGSVSPVGILGGMLGAAVLHALILQGRLARFAATGTVEATVPGTGAPVSGLLVSFALLALVQQVAVLIERVVAGSLGAGTVTHLSIAYRLATIPVALGVSSFIVPLYAHLERVAPTSSSPEFWRLLRPRMWAMVAFLLPCSAVLWGCGTEVVRWPLVRGEFSGPDAEATGRAIAVYALGLPCAGLAQVLTRALFARRQLVSTVAAAVAALLCYVAAAAIWRRDLDGERLALLMSLLSFVQAFVSWWFLLRAVPAAEWFNRGAVRRSLILFAALAFAAEILRLLPSRHPVLLLSTVAFLFLAYAAALRPLGLAPAELERLCLRFTR